LTVPETRVESFADVDDRALEAASRTVARAFRNEFGDAVDRDEVAAVAADLVQRVCQAARADEEPPPVDPHTASALGRYLLDRLSEEVFGGVSAQEPTRRVLRLVRAFDAVRRAVQPAWSDYFTSRLSGPGGLDLVVEVAHDLRSPLTSVLFLAETLQRGQSGTVNDVQHRQLGLIYGAALGLSTVTSDIIELARGGDRLVDQQLSPFSVSEIFESVRDIVSPIAEEKGLEIRVSPPPSDHRMGHPLALSRVLLNLTTNALKFADQGYVEIAATPGEHHAVEFAVRDTGRGISDDALETLYQPFRRAASRRAGYCFSGTGLGLAICRKLVEAMGASLEVQTRPDWGTRFSFALALPPATEL
jgi:signal transduction histidine kinase